MSSDSAPVRRSLGGDTDFRRPSRSNEPEHTLGGDTDSRPPSNSHELERISGALERIASALEGSGQSRIRPRGSWDPPGDAILTSLTPAGIETARTLQLGLEAAWILQIRLITDDEPQSQGIHIAVESKFQSIEEHVREKVRAAVADASAEKGMDLGWERVTYGWLVNEPDPIAQVAKELTDLKTGLHSQVLGKPMESMMIRMGAPEPVALLFGKVAEAAGLPPFDGPLVAARRLVELGGIVVGMASGNLILTSACFKALAHDELTHALAKALEAGFGYLGGVERRTQDVGTHEVDLYLEMTTPLIFEPPTAGLGPNPGPAALDVPDKLSIGTSSQAVPAPPGKRSKPFEPQSTSPPIWERPFSARRTLSPGASSPPTPVDPGLGDPKHRPSAPSTDLSIT